MSAAGGRVTASSGVSLGDGARNQEATCWTGNLDERVSEEMLWELFLQVGPVTSVYLPKDRVTGTHQGYGFVEFRTEEDADYATKVLNMVKLFDKPIRVTHSAQDRGQELGVGANIFVGNIGDEVDEKLLYDTFGAFGVVVGAPKVARDAETGNPRGFGFVSFDSFEASDAAIEAMDGQFLAGRAINVTYAFKKDSRGERHGTPAERMLAAARKQGKRDSRPNMHFAAGPAQPVSLGLPPPSAPAAVVPPAGMPPPPQMPAQMQPPAGMPMQPPPQQQPPGWMPPPPMAAGSAGRGLPPGMPPPPGAWGAPPLGMRPPGGQLPPMQGPPPGMPPPPAGPWGAAPVGVPPGMPPAAGHMPPPPR